MACSVVIALHRCVTVVAPLLVVEGSS